MSSFDNAIKEVLRHEGGYVNDPHDAGGETNFGICKRVYPKLDIKALTQKEAIELYKRDYWRPVYDRMPYQIAAKTFDMSVNMGHDQSHRLLQRAVGVVEDAIIGHRTLGAIQLFDVDMLLQRITDCQKEFYNRIIENKPSQQVFKKGWFARAEWKPVDIA